MSGHVDVLGPSGPIGLDRTTDRPTDGTAGTFWLVVGKQASAGAFGVYLLALFVLTRYVYPADWPIARYDLLFVAAVVFQLTLLASGLETTREARAIVVFHLVATGLELFATSDAIRAWDYPGEAVLAVGNVPLFAGFMYSAVGSYIARSWRLFDLELSNYPPLWAPLLLVLVVYVNFFTLHFTHNLSWLLLVAAVVLFRRSSIGFGIGGGRRHVPLLFAWLAVAVMIWVAENISTHAGVWLYPRQTEQWQLVSLSKLKAWFLLTMLSFVLVSLVHRRQLASRRSGDLDRI